MKCVSAPRPSVERRELSTSEKNCGALRDEDGKPRREDAERV